MSGRFRILPFLTDDKAVAQINLPLVRSLLQKAGLGFSAVASIGLLMWAEKNIIQLKG